MSLRPILGPAGSGKTKKLFETAIKEAGKNHETMYYFLVPEQFSMQTQYDLLSVHPKGGILNIDVTSMARLANAAFTKLSGMKHEFIPEIGKSMIIKKVLNDCGDKLVLYGRNAKHTGFVAEVKAMLSELFQYGITEEDLAQAVKDSEKEPVLKKKLQDALTLMAGFKTCLGDRLMTNESMYDAFAAVLEKSGIADNAVFILDGFTGFTPSQSNLLKEFMRLGKDVYVSFTIDEKSVDPSLPEYDVFHMSMEALAKLEKLAEEVGCDVKKPVFTDYDKYSSENLKALERGLFRTRAAKTAWDRSVVIYSANDVTEETKRTAAEIERLVRTQGYRYSDIAVVLGDIDLYGERLCTELDKVHASYFLDRKKTMHENECSGFTETVLKLMEKGADTDLLMAYAKNSLSGIDYDDACVLENYCKALGIRGSAFKKEFTKKFYGKQDIPLERVNRVRAQLMDELSGMLKVRRSTAAKYSDKMAAFLEKMQTEKRLEAIADEFARNNENLKAKEYSEVFDVLSDILTQAKDLLGDVEMDATEYRGLIEAGLSEAKVGLVPHGSDRITVGDIERTRLSHVRALFLLGANENKLPSPSGGHGIISDSDKRNLLRKGMELSPSYLKKIGNDKFYLYLTLTKPTDLLWISYPTSDGNDRLKPAPILSEITGLFTDMKIIGRNDLDKATKILENDLGLTAEQAELRRRNEKLARFAPYVPETVTPDEAKALYGEKLAGSISRLETYAKCPFKHFLSYGLGISKNESYKLDATDFGNISHEALEKYGNTLKERGLDWVEISETERNGIISECVRDVVDAHKEGILADTSKNKYISQRIEEALTLSVEMFTQQLKDTDFRPYEFEKKFVIDRDDFILNGKIDRIDVCDKEGLKAVKVVDYKSGNNDFDYSKLYYGLSLQLPAYLNVAAESLSPKIEGIENMSAPERVRLKSAQTDGFRPAAMLYDHVQDPVIDDNDLDFFEDTAENVEKIKDKITQSFKPTGLVNDDHGIVKSLDHSFGEDNEIIKESVTSLKVPVKTNKADSKIGPYPKYSAFSKVLPERELRFLLEYAVDKMGEGVKKIMEGDVAMTPVRSDKNVCKYCDFKSICGFDPKNGCKEKKLKKIDKETVLAKITEGEN